MKKLLFLFLIALSLCNQTTQKLSITPQQRQEILKQMRLYINQKPRQYGYQHLLKDISSFATALEEIIDASKDAIEVFLRQKGTELIPEFVNVLRNSLSQHDPPGVFNKAMYKEGQVDDWTEVLANVFNDGKELHIMYLKGVASGRKITQQVREKWRRCKKFLFFKRKCHDYWKNVDRQFYRWELNKIRDTLAFAANEKINYKLNELERK